MLFEAGAGGRWGFGQAPTRVSSPTAAPTLNPGDRLKPVTTRARRRVSFCPGRFVLGPWRWLIVLYKVDDESDTVMVASFEGGRSSAAAASSR